MFVAKYFNTNNVSNTIRLPFINSFDGVKKEDWYNGFLKGALP
jgi:hypothetical protein